MPELGQLRAFVAVAEELNFTRAADRLFLGQQAVSKSVRQLERELGVRLLERTTHEVWLTPAGMELLRLGRPALDSTDAAFARARAVGRGRAGAVRIGVSPAIGPAERATLVRALRDGAPDLTVSLRDLVPDEAAALLRRREVDFAVARAAPASDQLHTAPLPPAQAHLYLPAGHRLAAVPAPVPLANLDGERLLAWNPPGTPLTDLMISRLAAAGATVDITLSRVQGMSAVLSDLTEVAAVALLPPGWPHDDRVVELPLADSFALPLTIFWPADHTPAPVKRIRAAMT